VGYPPPSQKTLGPWGSFSTAFLLPGITRNLPRLARRRAVSARLRFGVYEFPSPQTVGTCGALARSFWNVAKKPSKRIEDVHLRPSQHCGKMG